MSSTSMDVEVDQKQPLKYKRIGIEEGVTVTGGKVFLSTPSEIKEGSKLCTKCSKVLEESDRACRFCGQYCLRPGEVIDLSDPKINFSLPDFLSSRRPPRLTAENEHDMPPPHVSMDTDISKDQPTQAWAFNHLPARECDLEWILEDYKDEERQVEELKKKESYQKADEKQRERMIEVFKEERLERVLEKKRKETEEKQKKEERKEKLDERMENLKSETSERRKQGMEDEIRLKKKEKTSGGRAGRKTVKRH